MGVLVVFLAACVGAAVADPATNRIVGGQPTVVTAYPEIVSLQRSILWVYKHACGGTVLTSRAVMTAAHCVFGDSPDQWRARVGSTYSTAGGVIYPISIITIHPQFNRTTLDNDIAVLRTTVAIAFGSTIKAASIAGANYNLPDNSSVVAVGWGSTSIDGPTVVNLRHVQMWTVNQTVCSARYQTLRRTVTNSMLCAGHLGVGGRDTCQGDSGGPLYHGRVVVGITSWGEQCALAAYPGISTRVSRFTAWIQSVV